MWGVGTWRTKNNDCARVRVGQSLIWCLETGAGSLGCAGACMLREPDVVFEGGESGYFRHIEMGEIGQVNEWQQG